MFLLADNYFFEVENSRVCNFYGRVGSYKTLSAVATAYLLLKSGRYKRVYANIPVSFASSPPSNIETFDFLSLEYAVNSIFIIDESALFLSGKHEEVSKIFAFPRKLNQVFLLASVLPTRQIESYCHLFVTRGYNLAMVGLPLLQFKSHPTYRCTEKEKVSHWLFGYSQFFQKYASKFRPSSFYPILQYRDTGTLYDAQSREVPSHISKFFIVNAWGQAIQKKHLALDEVDLINVYLPTFNEIEDIDGNDYPAIKPKVFINPLGAEFKLQFFFYFVFLLYFTFIVVKFIFNSTGNDLPVQKWKSCEYQQVLIGKSINLCHTTGTNNDIQKKPKQKATATAPVNFTIQK